MRRFIATVTILAAVLAAAAAVPARADDVMPPPWRGQPRSTMQEWTFTAGLFPPWSPDVVNNPYGMPSADLLGGTMVWHYEYEGRQGVVNTHDNAFTFFIPNHLMPGLEKRIWIQITYWSATPTYWEVLWPLGGYWASATPAESWFVNHPDGWTTMVASIVIPQNPPMETINVWWNDCSVWVDQVVIDTLCVPYDADINNDGVVDVQDLLALLAAWGDPGGAADINGDGVVDVQDLLILLASWGTSP
jgi:hypothetical protein